MAVADSQTLCVCCAVSDAGRPDDDVIADALSESSDVDDTVKTADSVAAAVFVWVAVRDATPVSEAARALCESGAERVQGGEPLSETMALNVTVVEALRDKSTVFESLEVDDEAEDTDAEAVVAAENESLCSDSDAARLVDADEVVRGDSDIASLEVCVADRLTGADALKVLRGLVDGVALLSREMDASTEGVADNKGLDDASTGVREEIALKLGPSIELVAVDVNLTEVEAREVGVAVGDKLVSLVNDAEAVGDESRDAVPPPPRMSEGDGLSDCPEVDEMLLDEVAVPESDSVSGYDSDEDAEGVPENVNRNGVAVADIVSPTD